MITSKVRLAAAAFLALAAPLSFAADNATLNISAQVKGVCKLSNTSYSMTFTPMDPSAAGSPDGTGTATVGYKCTKGTVPTLGVGGVTDGTVGFASDSVAAATAGGDLKGTLAANTDRLPYKITWTTPTAAGTGLGATATDVTLSGVITFAAYSVVTADTYTGSVGITVSP